MDAHTIDWRNTEGMAAVHALEMQRQLDVAFHRQKSDADEIEHYKSHLTQVRQKPPHQLNREEFDNDYTNDYSAHNDTMSSAHSIPSELDIESLRSGSGVFVERKVPLQRSNNNAAATYRETILHDRLQQHVYFSDRHHTDMKERYKQTLRAELNEQEKRLKSAHLKEVIAIKKDVASRRPRTSKVLKDVANETVNTRNNEIINLQSEEGKLKTLNTELRQRANDAESHVIKLVGDLAEARVTLDKERERHQDNTQLWLSDREQLETQTKTLENDHNNVKDEADQLRGATQQLEEEIQRHLAELEKVKREHQKELDSLRREHATTLEQLLAQQSTLRANVSKLEEKKIIECREVEIQMSEIDSIVPVIETKEEEDACDDLDEYRIEICDWINKMVAHPTTLTPTTVISGLEDGVILGELAKAIDVEEARVREIGDRTDAHFLRRDAHAHNHRQMLSPSYARSTSPKLRRKSGSGKSRPGTLNTSPKKSPNKSPKKDAKEKQKTPVDATYDKDVKEVIRSRKLSLIECISTKAGTQAARKNVIAFIEWAKTLGLNTPTVFTVSDLLDFPNERAVIFGLFDVARRCRGTVPSFITFERSRIHPRNRNNLKATDLIDKTVNDLLVDCVCNPRLELTRSGLNSYHINDAKQTSVSLKVAGTHVVMRVGGGWTSFKEWLKLNDKCRRDKGLQARRQVYYQLWQQEAFTNRNAHTSNTSLSHQDMVGRSATSPVTSTVCV